MHHVLNNHIYDSYLHTCGVILTTLLFISVILINGILSYIIFISDNVLDQHLPLLPPAEIFAI